MWKLEIHKRKFSCFSELLFSPQCSSTGEKTKTTTKKDWENYPLLFSKYFCEANFKKTLIRTRNTGEQCTFTSATFFLKKKKNYFLKNENSTSCGLWAHQQLSASDNIFLWCYFGILYSTCWHEGWSRWLPEAAEATWRVPRVDFMGTVNI